MAKNEDPSSTASPTLDDDDLHLLGEGTHLQLWKCLGARWREVGGTGGFAFSVWAPNARRVSLVGDFCGWDGGRHPMRRVGDAGVFDLFMPGFGDGEIYKYEIETAEGVTLLKADPLARWAEESPNTASRTYRSRHEWTDGAWMKACETRDVTRQPMAIYEVHLGSWKKAADLADLDRDGDDRPPSYRELAGPLVDHVKELGFNYIELMPVAEHPFDGSWGYQIAGYYAPTARYGTPDDFRYFVDHCHREGVGVILDWVPAHFPRDGHGLGYFDGTHLFEPADPRQGLHPDWHTFEFDYERPEVRSFLMSSAAFWLEEFHADGLRVDAVASMLYLDYSRKPGEWLPNEKGGRENLHAVSFLRDLNTGLHELFPGVLTFAEESTSWPGVTKPADEDGLGFDLKWNLGWMNDWLKFFKADPARRGSWLRKLTFGLTYAFAERFLLPLSHDEVVHGKRSLLGKMPGSESERLANLRVLLGCMFAHPGRKLLFMGSELAPRVEWHHDAQLSWDRLEDPRVRAFVNWLREVGRIYREEPALHAADDSWEGFEWIDPDDEERCVLSFVRRAGERRVLVIANLSDEKHEAMRFGVPVAAPWVPILSSEATLFGGEGDLPPARIDPEEAPSHGREQSIVLDVPALSVIWLEPDLDAAGDPASGDQGVA